MATIVVLLLKIWPFMMVVASFCFTRRNLLMLLGGSGVVDNSDRQRSLKTLRTILGRRQRYDPSCTELANYRTSCIVRIY